MNFTALVFGPGLPKGGERMGVRMDRGSLDFHTRDGRILEVPLSRLQLQLSALDDRHWEIGWEYDGEPWTLLLDHTAVQRELQADPPPGLKPQLARLRQAQRAARRGGSLRVSGLTGWLLAPLVVAIALLLNADRFAGWVVRHASLDQETQIGQQIWAAQRFSLQLVEGTTANQVLEELGERLTQGSAYRYRWRIANDPSLSAFAVPGGYIVVSSGLIEATTNAEELAAILAHEVQHIEQRHTLQAAARQAGLAMLMVLLAGDADGATHLGSDIAGLKFLNEAEREADAASVEAMLRSRIDPRGLGTILATLADAGPARAPWVAAHPDAAGRAQTLNQKLAQVDERSVEELPYRWTQVQASLRP